MKIIPNLVQGSAAWHEHRRTKHNASEAPAMLGESPYMTRTELLHRLATGITPEVDPATQKRFDKGHAVEALLRKVAEDMLGEPLHPFVAVADFDESLSASFDGCTFVGDTTQESKLLNERLRAAFADMETIAPEHRERAAGRCLPIDYRIQMEQQVRVAESERCLFITGELRDDGTLGDVLSCWYYPDDALWRRIEAGWPQLEADRATYVPAPAAPTAAMPAPMESLPAVTIRMEGALTVRTNLTEFAPLLRAFIERLPKEHVTDEDFATSEAACKVLKKVEDGLDAEEESALSELASVEAMRRLKAELKALARDNRLAREKIVGREKESRKGEIVAGGVKALAEYIAGLNKRLGAAYMPVTATAADFGGAVRGLKSLSSMEDKVATTLANAKIAASAIADGIDANLKALPGLVGDRTALIPDLAQLVLKSPDDFAAVVGQRVTVQREQEQRRAEAEAEKAREKIRAEEAAKLRQQQEQEAAAQRQREEEAARVERERLAAAAPTAAPEPPAATAAPTSAPAPATVHQLPARTAAPAVPAGPPTLSIGALNERIAPLRTDAAGLITLGFPPTQVGGGKYLHEHDYGHILAAMVAHLEALQAKQAA